ncbi:MAG: 50S ribosomal protein L7/L12 [Candidatus Omnitrophota bacterium]
MTEQVKEEQAKEEVKLSPKAEEIVKGISEMTVLELSELVKVLEDKFGVSAAMPMAVAAAPGAAAGGAAAAEEKTSFNVVLTEVGDKKIQVIKEIRTVTSLGLKEAKDLVDSAPKTVKENVSKEEAEEIKKKLEAQGAKIELK